MYYKIIDLWGNEQKILIDVNNSKTKTSFLDYDGFVEKFETKKTTDDCYTPDIVYKTILNYVSERVELGNSRIIRPFYPDCDYEKIDYLQNDVVIDNPPFSIISKIARFYTKKGIKFFLFSPHLTLFSPDIDCTCVVCGANIIYENGANVRTSFLSNLFGDLKILATPELYEALEEINKRSIKLPKYEYPDNVITVSDVQKLVERGVDFSLSKKHVARCRGLEDQKKHKKSIFGSGFLLSAEATDSKIKAEKAAAEKAAAEKAAAEKAAAEKEHVITWQLSTKEKQIIQKLG